MPFFKNSFLRYEELLKKLDRHFYHENHQQNTLKIFSLSLGPFKKPHAIAEIDLKISLLDKSGAIVDKLSKTLKNDGSN